MVYYANGAQTDITPPYHRRHVEVQGGPDLELSVPVINAPGVNVGAAFVIGRRRTDSGIEAIARKPQLVDAAGRALKVEKPVTVNIT